MLKSSRWIPILFTVFAGACLGSEATDPSDPDLAPIATITLSVPDGLQVGYGARVSFVLRDAANNVLQNRIVTFTSSDQSIATIDATGYIMGRGVGSTTITIRAEDKMAQAVAKVESAPSDCDPWWFCN